MIRTALTGFCVLILTVGRSVDVLSLPPDSRIVGGQDTSIKEIPWQLALNHQGRSHCGAALISNAYALTSARCADDRFLTSDLAVRARSTQDTVGGITVAVKRVIIPPKYDVVNVDYDIAVLELDPPITDDESSKPVPIAENAPNVGDKVQVSGYGTISETGGRPDALQSVSIPVVDQLACQYNYTGINLVTDRMFCAAAPRKDACLGDDGSPVTLNKVLVGLVSWGYGCARAQYSGVYTKINHPEIRDFIRQVTGI